MARHRSARPHRQRTAQFAQQSVPPFGQSKHGSHIIGRRRRPLAPRRDTVRFQGLERAPGSDRGFPRPLPRLGFEYAEQLAVQFELQLRIEYGVDGGGLSAQTLSAPVLEMAAAGGSR